MRNTNTIKVREDIIGVPVRNIKNVEVGTITEIMLNKVNNNITYVVLDCGSFLGLGGQQFILPWNSLHYEAKRKCYIVKINVENVQTIEDFDPSEKNCFA